MFSRREVGKVSLKALGVPLVPSNKVRMKQSKTKQKDKTCFTEHELISIQEFQIK